MSNKTKLFFYFLLAFLMILDIYLIFNAGNPNSLLRIFIADTGWDIFVTFCVSLCIVLISFLVFNTHSLEDDKIYVLLKANESHIEKLRSKGKTNEQIAESFLSELKINRLSLILIRKRVIKYLSEMK